jgi:ABC-type nitrate/sulfonate/bicarbonate transport system substrate-binding protein
MSLKKDLKLTHPHDLMGKKVGYGPNMGISWNAFLAVNGLKGKVTNVLTSRDASILTSGDVDAYVGWVTSDVLGLVANGQPVDYLLFGDWGLKLYDLTYCVAKSALKDKTKRAQIIALLKGEIRGWEEEIKNPAEGLSLTMNNYGKHLGLNRSVQKAQGLEQFNLIQSPTTKKHGLFWMSPSDIAKVVESFNKCKIPTKASLFDNSLLEEIYAGRSSL